MKNIKSYISSINILFSFIFLFASCKKDEPKVPEAEDNDMTLLVYAVVADLNLESDKIEMIEGVKDIDLSKNSLLLYEVKRTGEPKLLELVKDKSGNADFQEVKIYDREQYSTDPARISQVIKDAKTLRPAKEYGMIFWSHGTGWTPSFSNHGSSDATRSEVVELDLPSLTSFGSDKDLERDPTYTDETDIDELADAIPDHLFKYIWFDVCYMGGIETVYQLRNKCEYFIGMPTEDAGNGMPYQLTIPYLLKGNPDCVSAAEEFFRYYNEGLDQYWDVATVCVCKMSEIEPVAEFCRGAYSGATVPSSSGLQVYSRFRHGPFYDFGQYTRLMAESKEDIPDLAEFRNVMDNFVIYKAATEKDFAGRYIVQENFSGLSCHLYNPNDIDTKTAYYRSLDWYKRVYE